MPLDARGNKTLGIVLTDLQPGKKQYRAPFKVHCIAWNPVTDLLALASKKGDVTVKRTGWKKCWRISVNEAADANGVEKAEKQPSLQGLAWSPDGNVLAVSMSEGIIHLIDSEFGLLRWTARMKYPTTNEPYSTQSIKWFGCAQWEGFENTWKPTFSEVKAAAEMNDFGVDGKPESVERCQQLEELFVRSLQDTLLFAVGENMTILILAGGILPIKCIDVPGMCSSLGLDVINLYDVHFSSERTGISVAVTTYGPRPHCGGDGTFGVPMMVNDAVVCPHTHIINFSFKIHNPTMLRNLIHRYIKMYSHLLNFHTSYEYSFKDWANESQIFSNRMHSCGNQIVLGDALLRYLLCGVGDVTTELWLERHLQGSGVAGMKDFLDKRFNELLIFLRGRLSVASRGLAFQMDSFREEIVQLYESSIDCSQFQFRPNTDVNVYPYGANNAPDRLSLVPESSHQILNRLHDDAIKIQAKINEMFIVSTNNLRELYNLVRWMAMLSPVLRSRGQAQLPQSNRKADVNLLLRYLVETFVPHEDNQDFFKMALFDIDGLIKMMKDEEKEEHYDENSFYREIPQMKVGVEIDPDDSTKEYRRRTIDELLGGLPPHPPPRALQPTVKPPPITGTGVYNWKTAPPPRPPAPHVVAGYNQGVTQRVTSPSLPAEIIVTPMDEQTSSTSPDAERIEGTPPPIDVQTLSSTPLGTQMRQRQRNVSTRQTPVPAYTARGPCEIPSGRVVQHVLDKVACFWANEDELSPQTLDSLGERSALVGIEAILDGQRQTLCSLIKSVSDVVKESGRLLMDQAEVYGIKWMYELASDASHQGFKQVTLDKWFNRQSKEATQRTRNYLERREPHLKHGVRIMAMSPDSMAVISDVVVGHMTGPLLSGSQEDFKMDITVPQEGSRGCHFVGKGGQIVTASELNSAILLPYALKESLCPPIPPQLPMFPFENSPKSESQPQQAKSTSEEQQQPTKDIGMSLEIVIENPLDPGDLTEVSLMQPHYAGMTYVVGKFKTDRGVTHRLMKAHPFDNGIWQVHIDISSTYDNIEALFISSVVGRGIYLTEDGTRITLFHTCLEDLMEGAAKTAAQAAATEYRTMTMKRDRKPPVQKKEDFLVFDEHRVLQIVADSSIQVVEEMDEDSL